MAAKKAELEDIYINWNRDEQATSNSNLSGSGYKEGKDSRPTSTIASYKQTEIYTENISTSKKSRSKKTICIIIGIICLLVLAAAVATIVILLTRGDDKQPDQRVELVGLMVLSEKWTDNLADNSSEEYMGKKSEIEKKVDTALKTGKTAVYYQTTEVINLRPGSIRVNMVIVLFVYADDIRDDSIVVGDTDTKVEITQMVEVAIESNVDLAILSVEFNVKGSTPTSTEARETVTTTLPQQTTTAAPATVPTTLSQQTTTAAQTTVPTTVTPPTTTTAPVTVPTSVTPKTTTTARATVSTTLPQQTTTVAPATVPGTGSQLSTNTPATVPTTVTPSTTTAAPATVPMTVTPPITAATTPTVSVTVPPPITTAAPATTPTTTKSTTTVLNTSRQPATTKLPITVLTTVTPLTTTGAPTTRPPTRTMTPPTTTTLLSITEGLTTGPTPTKTVALTRVTRTTALPITTEARTTKPFTTRQQTTMKSQTTTFSSPFTTATRTTLSTGTISLITTRFSESVTTVNVPSITTKSLTVVATSTIPSTTTKSATTTESRCLVQSYFWCGGSQCIPGVFRCDGTAQCNDGSDERGCVTQSGARTEVYRAGQMRILCSNGDSTMHNVELATAICLYLGHTNLGSVSVDSQTSIPLGVIFLRQNVTSGYLGNFEVSSKSDCSPLIVACGAEEVKQCGKSKVPLHSNYVQYGDDALPGQWPWQAHIKRRGLTVCGGTLINTRWVLTAAHCVSDYPASSFSVVLGSHTRLRNEAGQREFNVIRVEVHPNYTKISSRSIYDIALFLLNDTITFTDDIQPACLPQEELNTRRVCYITGWGKTNTGDTSNTLQQIKVSTHQGKDCDPLWTTEDIIDNMICATRETSRYSPSCQGDSGGPLVCLNSIGRWDVHGVVSFGPSGCRVTQPDLGVSVLTSVYHFMQWIDETMVCHFTCGDGTCLYSRGDICDGKTHCADSSDEIILCEKKPSCDFEYLNICGYSTEDTTNGWRRLSINTTEQVKAEGIPYDHTTNALGGSYMHLYQYKPDEQTPTPAVLRSPVLGQNDRDWCLQFYFYLYLKRGNTPASLEVKSKDQNDTEWTHWSVYTSFGARWNFMSVTLPSDSVVFLITGTGTVSVDDVTLAEGRCPPISCVEEGDETCGSPSLCLESSLFCDALTQCHNNTNSIDEDPILCGASLNCTFSDEYMCGYKEDDSRDVRWTWHESSVYFSLSDHTTKTRKDGQGSVVSFLFGGVKATTIHLESYSSLIVPQFTTDTISCLEFYYVSARVTEQPWYAKLRLVEDTDGSRPAELWTRSYSQGNKWRLGQVRLDAGTHNLKFVALVNRYTNVIAQWQFSLDDVRLVSSDCRPSVVSCSRDEFRCSVSQCIPESYVCDKVPNCENGKDETPGCVKEPLNPVRLVGGGYPYQGRVEIFHGGSWGTICYTYWSSNEASVVCMMLGLSTNASLYQSNYFGEGPDHWLQRINCNDEDTSLDDCTNSGWGVGVCSQNKHATIRCGDHDITDYRQDNVRLVGNVEGWAGRVEVYHNNEWGTVCRNGWNDKAARVVCRMMGYGEKAESLELGDFTPGSIGDKIWMSEVDCSGNESRLSDCGFSGWRNNTCSHSQDVGVKCLGGPGLSVPDELKPASPKDSIRLVGGASVDEGRVEILFDGQWGTICSDNVTQTEADVICETLGYSGKGFVLSQGTPGSGPIHLDNVNCHGNKNSLFDCEYSLGIHDCDHYEDLHIRCEEDPFLVLATTPVPLRLIGGNYYGEGKLEIFREDAWQSVCYYHSHLAKQLCGMLGFRGYAVWQQADDVWENYQGWKATLCDNGTCVFTPTPCSRNDVINSKLACTDTACPHGMNACPQNNSRGDVICIREDAYCDGNPDCPNSTDETSCSNCTSSQMTCDGRTCLPLSARCDGVLQCNDGTDEHGCLYRAGNGQVMVEHDGTMYPVCMSSSLNETSGPEGMSLASQICHRLGQGSLLGVSSYGLQSVGVTLLSLDWSALRARTLSSQPCEIARIRCESVACGKRPIAEPEQHLGPTANQSTPRYSIEGEWPWYVSIDRKGSVFCSGVMVAPEWLLSWCISGGPFPWMRRDDHYYNVSFFPLNYFYMNGSENVRYEADTMRIVHAAPVWRQYESGQPAVASGLGLTLLVPRTDEPRPVVTPICLSDMYSVRPENPVCYALGTDIRYLPPYAHSGQEEVRTSLVIDTCAHENQPWADDTFCLSQESQAVVCQNTWGMWEVVGLRGHDSRGSYINVSSLGEEIREVIRSECIFRCPDDDQCLYDHIFLCDGVSHCADGSDEAETRCVISPTCTFEYGDCGYIGDTPSHWRRIRAREDLFDLTVPIRDHTTMSNRGYVLTTSTQNGEIRDLWSPDLGRRQQEQCLRFYLHTVTNNILSRLTVFAESEGLLLLARLRVIDFKLQKNNPKQGSDTFGMVYATLPSLSERFLLRLSSERAADRSFETTISIDDITLEPGRCQHESVNCSFTSGGLCGYTVLDDSTHWITAFSDDTKDESIVPALNRHLVFNASYGNTARIVSPGFGEGGCFFFSYRFAGRFGGTLGVYTVGETDIHSGPDGKHAWSLSSSGQSTWRTVSFSVSGDRRVVFEGRGGFGRDDFIRVDDIQLVHGTCSLPACSENEFSCAKVMTCVPRDEVCNGVPSCSSLDLSDETTDICGVSASCSFETGMCGYMNSSDSQGIWRRGQTGRQNPLSFTPIRLVNGLQTSDTISGRVEVYHSGLWGTVCDDKFGPHDASVICRMLGYQDYKTFSGNAAYGRGSGTTWLDELACSGEEDDLALCRHDGWGVEDCTHSEDVGVECYGKLFKVNVARPTLPATSGFGAMAKVVSPDIRCTKTNETQCDTMCMHLWYTTDDASHSKLTVFSEDGSSQFHRLWTTATGVRAVSKNVTVPLTVGIRRLIFIAYHSALAFSDVLIIGIELIPCNALEQPSDISCNSTVYTCKNGHCVDKEMMCDGIADCVDASDEWGANCVDASPRCTFKEGHTCGYSSVSRSSPWQLSSLTALQLRLPFGVPFYDHDFQKEGSMLFVDNLICGQSSLVISELIFPPVPYESGACIQIYYASSSNFSISTPLGILLSAPPSPKFLWRFRQADVPRSASPLPVSLLAECVKGYVIIDEIIITSGSCPASKTSVTHCPESEKFLCSDGSVVPCGRVCDKIPSCIDGSDEVGCACSLDEMSCGDEVLWSGVEKCVAKGRRCDGYPDCPNLSDEMPGCSCSDDYRFTCDDGSCIDAIKYCDGIADCSMSEDEVADCDSTCDASFKLECPSGKCIQKKDRCNYEDDCGDLFDERNCTCREGDHRCEKSGICYNPEWSCDGEIYCPDGEDEGAHCLQCNETQTACLDGLCIAADKLCDGTEDCNDGSDEWNCSNCDGFRCEQSGICLPLLARCDGDHGCWHDIIDDFSDELNCSCSGSSTRRCDNGMCKDVSKWCDGVDDCFDNSDERNCSCREGQARCDDGECIRGEWWCDGNTDCIDASDESDCPSCSSGQERACFSNVCLDSEMICDGEYHCDDRSDEHQCGSIQNEGGSDTGTVYFKKGLQTYPLCPDGLEDHILNEICRYIAGGVREKSGRSTAGLSQDFLTYSNPGATNLPLTAGLQIGACTSGDMLTLSCRPSECGVQADYRRSLSHVLGGDMSELGRWPWVISLFYMNSPYCGGSIVNAEWVVTAAHCVHDRDTGHTRPAAYFKVFAGLTNLRNRDDHNVQHRGISNVFYHPDFRDAFDGDIALIKLDQPFELSTKFVRPACQSTNTTVIAPTSCYVAGWGWTQSGQSTSSVLDMRHARLSLFNTSLCDKRYHGSYNLTDNICAGYENGLPGSCHGDSGGPLMCKDSSGYWTLVGVVNGGVFNCPVDDISSNPAVFASVTYYRHWIDETIADNS